MINLKTYEKILDNPEESKKLFDSGFNLMAYEGYALKYAILSQNFELIKVLKDKGSRVDDRILFELFIKSDYSDFNKEEFREELKRIAESQSLRVHFMRHLTGSIPELEKNSRINNFSKYFAEFASNFSRDFVSYFIEEEEIYPIHSRASLELVINMYMGIDRDRTFLKASIPHKYFGMISNLEEIYFSVKKEYVEDLIYEFLGDPFLRGDHISVSNIIKWSGNQLFSRRIVVKLLEMDSLSKEQRIILSRSLTELNNK